ncbi:PIN domain-containing protein [Roseateles sp.]|uniref:type II toxin-antitoxin system VapC family toxin n=1 Tax=Roseateles sp. TaxID=1971397 RepID=UPI003262DE6B
MNAALIDAGPLIALFDPTSVAHRHYAQLLPQGWMLTTTWPCVVEASHFLKPAANQRLLSWVAAGAVAVFPFDVSQLPDIADLMARYTEWPRTEMDFADATLVWLASEAGVTQVMTMDVRDFSRYRLADGRAFEIL